ncbi:MAG: type II toxin-antitoxin system prevent-host-death family antitoxin [Novosphingobium sp.]
MAPNATRTVTIHEAKTNLSRLIAAVEAGEEVVIARGKTPAVRMVPIATKPHRVPGLWKGKIHLGPEFFEPMSEEDLALWEGRDDSL